MNIDAGSLRHRIIIQAPADVADEINQPISTWVDLCSVWASITPLNGKEQVNATAVFGLVTHKIQIRWMAGISTKHRIKFENRIFHITGPPIDPEELHETLVMICTEVA